MSIFKDIAIRYCERIYHSYTSQVDQKTYIGKEARLLIQRNDYAHSLIESLKKIDVLEGDYEHYFEQFLKEIDKTFQQVKDSARDYNKANETQFTADLYESFFTLSLSSFIHALYELYKNSPKIVKQINDPVLFTNNKDLPWMNRFCFVLYDYIIEKEFELATTKANRDIFDAKIKLILKYIENAEKIHERFGDESENGYSSLMIGLLQNMQKEESDIQQRKPKKDSAPNSMYSFLTQSIYTATYKATGQLIGGSQLGEKINILIRDFKERSYVKEAPSLT